MEHEVDAGEVLGLDVYRNLPADDFQSETCKDGDKEDYHEAFKDYGEEGSSSKVKIGQVYVWHGMANDEIPVDEEYVGSIRKVEGSTESVRYEEMATSEMNFIDPKSCVDLVKAECSSAGDMGSDENMNKGEYEAANFQGIVKVKTEDYEEVTTGNIKLEQVYTKAECSYEVENPMVERISDLQGASCKNEYEDIVDQPSHSDSKTSTSGDSRTGSHVLNLHPQKPSKWIPYTCNVCGYKSRDSSHCRRHMMSHTGEKPFACNLCDSKFTQSYHLKRHMMSHTGEKPFACDMCEYRCSRSGLLKKHVRTHTGEKPFPCNVCDYKFSTSGSLKSHMMSHTEEKPLACNICDYKCRTSGTLKRHVMGHTGEKSFSCNVCDYKSSLSSNLKSHMLIHTGEKHFACNVCDFSCRNSSYAKRHMMIHTGETPYNCSLCDFTCRQSSDIKRHIMTHIGEKPFVCHICDFKCGRRANLRRHMMSHSGE